MLVGNGPSSVLVGFVGGKTSVVVSPMTSLLLEKGEAEVESARGRRARRVEERMMGDSFWLQHDLRRFDLDLGFLQRYEEEKADRTQTKSSIKRTMGQKRTLREATEPTSACAVSSAPNQPKASSTTLSRQCLSVVGFR